MCSIPVITKFIILTVLFYSFTTMNQLTIKAELLTYFTQRLTVKNLLFKEFNLNSLSYRKR